MALIAVMDEGRLIASNHGIPWHLPRDVAYFRDQAKDQWLLVGRTTYEEMVDWFRGGHWPLVLSGSCGWDPPLGQVVASVPQALALAAAAGHELLVCLGGGAVFASALPYADELWLTQVATKLPPGEEPVYFPQWDEADWTEFEGESFPADDENAYGMRIRKLRRVRH